MREEDLNWFSKWEEELPPPEELTPLSQTLISRDLALAFNIQTPNSTNNFTSPHLHHQMSYHIHRRSNPAPAAAPAQHLQSSGDFDSSSAEFGGGGSVGGGSEEPARTLKRPRLVWTPQLHKRFVDVVAHLGIKNAVPKMIMQLMSVDGLTRENVASHLQKYKLYLKRMQGLNDGAGLGGGGSGDSATDHLFASSPVPAHFLHPQGGSGGGGGDRRANSEQFMGYVPPPAYQQQVAAMVAGGQYPHHHHQPQHHRQMGHFGSPTSGGGSGQFEHPLLSRQAQTGGRLGGGGDGGGRAVVQSSVHGYVEDLESRAAANCRKSLTLFPTSD